MSRVLRATTSVALVLGAAIVFAPAASAVSPDSCVYDSPTKIVSVIFPAGANQSRTVSREPNGNKIYYNGSPCGTATVNNTNTIYVITGDGAQSLTIDLSDGPFAPGATGESGGKSEIEFEVDLGAGTDSITVNGGNGADAIRFDGKTKVELNGDADSDVHLLGTEGRSAYGNGGNDHLLATSATPDVSLLGGNGSDTLVGGGGEDDLEGGGDNDVIVGNAGGDAVYGGGGADDSRGGDQGDYFYGGGGNDVFNGGAGNDYFYAESGADGADRFFGGSGSYDDMSYYSRSTKVVADLDGVADDGAVGEHDLVGKDVEELEGGDANDVLTGSGGDNYLDGNGGADLLKGGDGDDNLYGDDGNDTLRGGDGEDGLTGAQDNDVLYGDAGDDGLYSDNTLDGDDDFHGGTGIDSLYYYGRSASVWIRIGGTNEGGIGEADTIRSDVENGTGGSAGDVMTGTGADNGFYGNGGADTIDGDAGSDYLNAGAGNDVVTGGDGYDYVYGGDDNDTLHLTDGGTDYADCGLGTDVASDHDVYDTTLNGCETT
jgi:Ca2+-binding RTX toxin-like protein